MPRILEADELDVEEAAIDLEVTAAEEAFQTAHIPDLTDGDKVRTPAGVVDLYPTAEGKRLKKGRAAAVGAWMWNGTETVLTLAWNPDGKRNDGARNYLSKKHCLCCGDSGFRGHCRKCRKDGCQQCRSSTSKKQIIPCFYLRKQDVPFQEKFYGDIDCFLPFCSRRGSAGFQSEEDMRMHANSRHTKQYEAYEAVQRSNQSSEIDSLKALVNTLVVARISTSSSLPTVPEGAPTPPASVVTESGESNSTRVTANGKVRRRKGHAWTEAEKQAARDRYAAKRIQKSSQ